jgi:hypothetical protein
MIQHAPSVMSSSDSDRPAFLGTHRAQSVAGREFSRLSDAIVAAAKRAGTEHAIGAPTVRCSPDRCIVQLGPVALTVAYIRNGTSVPTGGQLLAIIWRGTIAQRGDHIPERLKAFKVPAVPVQVWEETHVVSADSEATWHWHPRALDECGYTSVELAEQCIGRLTTELQEFLATAVEMN